MATIAEQLTSLANTKTAIKQAIVDKGVAVTDDTPFSGYAAKIGEISGGGGATKYGLTIDAVLGDADANGALQVPTGAYTLNFSGVVDLGANALSETFNGSLGKVIQSIAFPDLTAVSGNKGLYSAFASCTAKTADFGALKTVGAQEGFSRVLQNTTSMETINFGSLVTITGRQAFYFAFYGSYASNIDFSSLEDVSAQEAFNSAFQSCNNVVQMNFGALKTIGQKGFYSALRDMKKLVSVNFDSLETVGSQAFSYCFFLTNSLKSISFPSLKNVQANSFSNAFYTGLEEIHFRADMQATIEACDGYSSKFGATNATIYFDL